MKKSLLKRFEDKYIFEPNTGCWLWTAASDSSGYGMIRAGENYMSKAHRVSWRLYRGEIPQDMYVCHTCDTPSCVNPNHLFLGTHTDNMRDMASKGRSSGAGSLGMINGENNGQSKLTEEAVKDIRKRYRRGNRYHVGNTRELAHIYGIRPDYVFKIYSRKVWKHVK